MHNCAFVILLISVRTFFSLSSLCTTNELSLPLLIFFFLRCTQRNTPTPTHKQTHTDKPTKRQIGARGFWSVLDRSTWVLIGARGSWSILDRSLWILIGAWLELVGPDLCLTEAWSLLDWSSSWSVLMERSELVGLLLERSLTEKGLA